MPVGLDRAVAGAVSRRRRSSPTSRLTTRVNGEVRQQDRTGRMLFDFRQIVIISRPSPRWCPATSSSAARQPGPGARFDPPIWLKPGDVIEVEAEGIGCLRNGVADEDDAGRRSTPPPKPV